MNKIQLKGKVANLEVKYNETYEWWNANFTLEGCFLMDDPMECYIVAERKEPPLEEGMDIIISGAMCEAHNEIYEGNRRFAVQVHGLMEVKNEWGCM